MIHRVQFYIVVISHSTLSDSSIRAHSGTETDRDCCLKQSKGLCTFLVMVHRLFLREWS